MTSEELTFAILKDPAYAEKVAACKKFLQMEVTTFTADYVLKEAGLLEENEKLIFERNSENMSYIFKAESWPAPVEIASWTV